MIPIIDNILGIADTVIDKAIPDKGQADKLKHEMSLAILKSDDIRTKAQGDIIKQEAKGNWYTATWRPTVMYLLVGLVGAHWIGLTPESVTEDEVKLMLQIVWTGLGGYVVGRSGEKIASQIMGNKK